MNQYVTIIGTVGDKDGAGLFSTQPGTWETAEDDSKVALAVFAKAKERYGVKAFPYGEPYVDIVMVDPYKTPQAMATNFVYDAMYDEDVCDWDFSEVDVQDFRGERLCASCRREVLTNEILSGLPES